MSIDSTEEHMGWLSNETIGVPVGFPENLQIYDKIFETGDVEWLDPHCGGLLLISKVYQKVHWLMWSSSSEWWRSSANIDAGQNCSVVYFGTQT